MKNRCEQSSTALAHSGHSTGEFRTMRCCMDIVIRHRHRKSRANILIFRGRRCFHTKRHLYRRTGSSDSPWFWSSLYAARTVKLGPLHSHVSWAPSDKRWSASSSCSLTSSSTRWLGNDTSNAGAHASCQARCTEIPRSVDHRDEGKPRSGGHVSTNYPPINGRSLRLPVAGGKPLHLRDTFPHTRHKCGVAAPPGLPNLPIQ